jgi:hypothetical protein
MQYSVAHSDWHAPLLPQSQAAMSRTMVSMPAVCACWQQVTQALPVDIAAHVRSICPVFPPLLPEVLPPAEPPGLPEVPLLLPALLPPVPLVPLPLEPPAVLPEPLPLFVMRELPLLGVLPEQPLAYATIGTARHAVSPKQCLTFTAILPWRGMHLRALPRTSMFAPREPGRVRRRASARSLRQVRQRARTRAPAPE